MESVRPNVEVTNLTKVYGQVTAIKDVSFSIARGEIVGFLGPNGAGKSTTLRILCGLLPATSGTARICEIPVASQPDEIRRRIGYMAENNPLPEDMRVIEYLKGGVSPFGRWFAVLNAPAAAKIATALYRLEQGHRANVRSVGKGVYEYKIHFGPGYRIYFGQEGESAIVLLGGGSKKTQAGDILRARARWAEYKTRT